MLVPSIFGRTFFDDLDDMFNETRIAIPVEPRHTFPTLKTDIKEHDDKFEFSIDVPGIKKDNLNIELKNGYMLVSVTEENNKDEKNKDGKYIRRERYFGSSSRSFYVGKDVKGEDIKAKFDNGILSITIPKKEKVEEKEEKKVISIE